MLKGYFTNFQLQGVSQLEAERYSKVLIYTYTYKTCWKLMKLTFKYTYCTYMFQHRSGKYQFPAYTGYFKYI